MATAEPTHRPYRREILGLWMRWLVASMIGGGLGLTLGAFLTILSLTSGSGLVGLIGLGLAGGVAGWVLGASQAWGMQGRLRLGPRWALVTGLGWALGFPVAVIWLIDRLGRLAPLEGLLIFTTVGAGIGLIAGLGQWWLLRPSRPPLWPWLLGMIMAYAAGWGLSGWGLQTLVPGLVGGLLGMGVLSGAVGGLISGGLIIWLLPDRSSHG